METDADRLVSSILDGIDDFRIEVGSLTLLFSRVEDALVQGIVHFAEQSSNEDLLRQAKKENAMQLRLLEKRDLLKATIAETGRSYGIDSARMLRLLDKLGNLNRFRRAIVHGAIRWSFNDEKPVFVDSHGNAFSAWPWDVLSVNQKVNEWLLDYFIELRALVIAIVERTDSFYGQLQSRKGLDSKTRELFALVQSGTSRLLKEVDAKAN